VKPKLIIDSEVRSHAISVRSNAIKLRSTASDARLRERCVRTSLTAAMARWVCLIAVP
jgi:hypothetical protein